MGSVFSGMYEHNYAVSLATTKSMFTIDMTVAIKPEVKTFPIVVIFVIWTTFVCGENYQCIMCHKWQAVGNGQSEAITWV